MQNERCFDTLISNGQSLTEEKLVNFILDAVGVEFEPMVVYIIRRMKSSIEKTSLAKVKSILQKYDQKLSKTSIFSLNFNGMNANLVKQTNSLNL